MCRKYRRQYLFFACTRAHEFFWRKKIFEDLKYINNKNKLWINCQNLFHGKIGNLEKFIGFELKTKKIEKINTKDNLIDEQIPYLDTKSILYNENKNLYDKINNLYSKLKEKEKKIII